MRLLTPPSLFGWQWETPLADAYVGTALHVSGAHSLEELHGLAALLSPDDRVLDGGANLGALALPLAKAGARVVAVEPQAQILDCLVATAVRARLTGAVTPIHAALGAAAGTVAMPQPSLALPLNFGGLSVGAGAEVPVVTVDQLARDHGPFALVKLDLEGQEPAALAGATETLAAGAVWCVEVDREDATAAVVATFTAHGYQLFRWSPALEAPHAHVVSHNLLAVPAGRTVTLPVGATAWA